VTFFIGLDLGQVSEPTALVVVESDTLEQIRTDKIYKKDWITYQPVYRGRDGKETTEQPQASYALRHIERVSPGTAYPAIVERVQKLVRMVQKPTLAVDVTGVGTPVSDLFREAANLDPHLIQVVAGDIETRDGSLLRVPKRELVSTAQVLLQTKRLRIARGLSLSKLLIRELSSFRMRVTLGQKDDPPTVWREGTADDLVLGLSIALWLAERHSGVGFSCIVGRPEFSWGDSWGSRGGF
jgi:hypothetical protein